MQSPQPITADQALVRLRDLVGQAAGRRIMIGVVGEPGAGKTTLAHALVEGLRAGGVAAVSLPMDGFHLADVQLDRLGTRDRKGAIDTFDAHGYLAVLRRVRRDEAAPIYAPTFERDLEQPIAGAVAILPDHRVVISEGNYLLDSEAPWPEIAAVFDQVWAVDTPQQRRLQRLVSRHQQFGKSPDAARAWVAEVDEANARRIRERLPLADLVISLT